MHSMETWGEQALQFKKKFQDFVLSNSKPSSWFISTLCDIAADCW